MTQTVKIMIKVDD
ncbi:unnamed protein product [Candida parapsilosis]